MSTQVDEELGRKKVITNSSLHWLEESADPGGVAGGVVHQLFRVEPEGDFCFRIFGAVAAVDEVVLDAQAEVSADGSGGGETPREPTGMDTCLLLLPKPTGSTTPRVTPWRLWALGGEDVSPEGHLQ